MHPAAERNSHPVFADERAELRTLLASKAFSKSPLLSRMLAYICAQYFAGKAESLKEYSIGATALGRGPGFDPNSDSIVRVMGSRLRKRLAEYYAGDGAGHRIRLHLSDVGYTPVFRAAPVVESGAPPVQRAGQVWSRVKALWTASVAILLLVTAGAAYLARSGEAPLPVAASAIIPSIPARNVESGAASAETRIKVGLEGSDWTDNAGTLWRTDRFYRGGAARQFAERPIWRTLDPLLYLSAREGDFRYDIPLAPGIYELHLYFAETVYGIKHVGDFGEGSRLFDVWLNDKPLLSEFDIISDSIGFNTADERVFKDVSPAPDGLLHLRFSSNPQRALLSAIEILPAVRGKMLPVRIVTSETPVHDKAGRSWRRDQYFLGGNAAKWIRDVAGPEDRALYYTYRWGHFNYAIPVAEGSYRLTLKFVEPWFGAQSQVGGTHAGGAGSRLFDIYCNGEALLRQLDVCKEAGGPNRQFVKTFRNLKPNPQGKLNVSFVPVKNTAVVTAIEVIPE